MSKIYLLIPFIIFIHTGHAGELDKFDELVHIVMVKRENNSSDKSRGSGFVVGRNGRIVTNYHVISPLFKNGKVDEKYKIFVKNMKTNENK